MYKICLKREICNALKEIGMGYLVYNNPNVNKAFAINKDKIIHIELDRAHKCLKVVYNYTDGKEQSTMINCDSVGELERIFNELTR